MPRIREPQKVRVSQATLDRATKDEKKQINEIAARTAAATGQEASSKTGDAYQNFQQSIGIGTDNALTNSTYGFNPITRIRVLLEWIYRGSWLGGVAVDIIADDMTRAGIDINSTMPPEDIEALQDALIRLGIWPAYNENLKWGRLYGGSIAVMLIDGQDPSQPLNIERIAKGAFKGLLVLDRWMVEPDLSDLVTEYGPDIGLPKYYRVTADAPAMRGRKIHHSRCLRCEGIRLPYWQRVMENLWGLSVFERLYDRMLAFDSATMGMAQLVYKSYLRTYKLKGMRKILAEGGQAEKALMNWVMMTKRLQGNEGITLIDGEDEFVPSTQNAFTGISEAVMQIAQQLSGALQIPITRMFGQAPAGLNATGEHDENNYKDGIKQRQENEMRMPFTKILTVTCRSEAIKIPDKFGFTFRDLYQLSEETKSKIFASDSAAIADLEAGGLIQLFTALKELRSLSRATGRMTNITDNDIEDAESAPPRPREGFEDPEAPGPDNEGAEDPGIKGKPNSEKPAKLKAVK
jgi:phage-related protein (TIGR01555 family)